MEKLKSTLPNMVVVLGLITAVMAALLATVYNVTKAPIDEAKALKTARAIGEVVPNDSISEAYLVPDGGKEPLTFYDCYRGGQYAGSAVRTYDEQGFSGKITLMVGFDPAGVVIKSVALEQNETPGLGDKMAQGKSSFPDQFEGKCPREFRLKVKKDGGDVDAITAATISSRAYCRAVERAHAAFMSQKGGQQ